MCVDESDLESSEVCKVSYAGIRKSVLSQNFEKSGKLRVKTR